ncbi:MAG: cytochrome c [Alphaproteobacteria bacterium]|jgi:mono/diheme cytochrome c family protein|nr:cytochrome c [Alphaproteobacteria bacterium]MDP7641585.1 cytochrome c [Alphaproteobacteria bacterium]
MKLISMLLLAMALTLWALPGHADPAAGEAAFKAGECTACHYTDGPAKEKTIDDQLAKKGPELWYAGSKFQREWLEAWLQDPAPTRQMKFNSVTKMNPGDHPKLAAADAANVSDFLMGLTSDAVKAGVVKPKKNAKGRLIFTKKMPCSGCHQYEGRKKKLMGGRSGPTLVGAGKRLNPDWIYAYLLTPEIFKPVKAMPVFVGLLSEKDMKNVAAYVANFK